MAGVLSKPAFFAKAISGFGPPRSSSNEAVAMFWDHASPWARHAVGVASLPTLSGVHFPCGVLNSRGLFGSVEAEVVVMRDPGEFASMKRGAILVAPATDPSWTPLFTLASGVIVEVGGMLSHASTIAREYGLPALANVKNATRLLKTGDRVRLDASGGRVIR